MKPWLALVKREFLEHRGAFLYAPAIITLVVAIVLTVGVVMNRPEITADAGDMPGSVMFFEFAFLAAAFLWSIYMVVALFFYFSDSFHADRRNNSMLFWKSMPKSDLEVLGSKVIAGYTVFPLAIGFWILVSGLITYAFAHVVDLLVIFYTAPNLLEFANSFFQVTITAFVYIVIVLVWYAPIWGWAAFLGTLFKRWSIPLFFVIPALAVLLERVINIRNWNYESQILKFIQFRLEMSGEEMEDFNPEVWLLGGKTLNAQEAIAYGLSQVDWMHTAIGIILLGGFVYLASEYRRRLIEA